MWNKVVFLVLSRRSGCYGGGPGWSATVPRPSTSTHANLFWGVRVGDLAWRVCRRCSRESITNDLYPRSKHTVVDTVVELRWRRGWYSPVPPGQARGAAMHARGSPAISPERGGREVARCGAPAQCFSQSIHTPAVVPAPAAPVGAMADAAGYRAPPVRTPQKIRWGLWAGQWARLNNRVFSVFDKMRTT
eukprot:gene22801-biopygen5779